MPVDRVLIDGGSAINVMPQIILQTLQKNKKELIPTKINVQGFVEVPAIIKAIMPVELRVGIRNSVIAFFRLRPRRYTTLYWVKIGSTQIFASHLLYMNS